MPSEKKRKVIECSSPKLESEIVWSKFRMREEDVGSERVQSLVDRVSTSLAVSPVGRERKQKFTIFLIKGRCNKIHSSNYQWIP